MVFGLFGGGSSGNESSSMAIAQIEQQIQMMDMVFKKSVKQCRAKCIPAVYKDGELNKGEAVCLQRCLKKYFDALELVSAQLSEVGMQSQGMAPSL